MRTTLPVFTLTLLVAACGDGTFATDGGSDGAPADLGSADGSPSLDGGSDAKPSPDLLPAPMLFAVVGDFGSDDADEYNVSKLIKSWKPEFVVTTGDNTYLEDTAAGIDAAIGKYYSEFIGQYQGVYGPGSMTNRFWPSLGNHDWYNSKNPPLKPWYDYFPVLPGNKRYYEVEIGPVHFIILDSDPLEPDGVDATSKQGLWAQAALANSTACHRLVIFHHPPHGSAGFNGPWMRWPFKQWGATAILVGHEHTYERLDWDGLPLFIDGLGGAKNRFGIVQKSQYSQFFYNADFGAMRLRATRQTIIYEFWNVKDQLIDTIAFPGDCRK